MGHEDWDDDLSDDSEQDEIKEVDEIKKEETKNEYK